jgi:hypothetical protein
LTSETIKVILGAVKLAPLNIKIGHYPNLQRYPSAFDILRGSFFTAYIKKFAQQNYCPRGFSLWIGKFAKIVKMTVFGVWK